MQRDQISQVLSHYIITRDSYLPFFPDTALVHDSRFASRSVPVPAMLLLPNIVISLPYHEEAIASSSQAPSSSKTPSEALEETKKWLEVKVREGDAPAEALKLVHVPKILHHLFKLQRRSAELTVSFKLINDTGRHILLQTEACILRDLEFEEQGAIVFEGDRDMLFFLEHVQARDNKSDDGPIGDCGVVACDACVKSESALVRLQSRFRLEFLFETLSVEQQDTVIPEPPAAPQSSGDRTSLLADLPEGLALRVMSFMNPSDLHRLSMTCQWWRYHVQRGGVNLRLHPHQERAIVRMLNREKNPGSCAQTAYEAIKVKNTSRACYGDMIDGSIYAGAIPSRKDFRGGLFCDEPGLGKTITALSLFMRTRGVIPKAPQGGVLSSSADRQRWSYEIPSEILVTGRMVALGSGSGSRRRRSSKRSVSRPDYLNPEVGVGSVPDDVGKSVSQVLLSPATLILMPTRLLNHWKVQIEKHLQKGLVRVGVLHSIDFASIDEPPAVQVAYNYDIILATIARVRNEYETMRSGNPLLAQIRFLRVIIDEGHALGSSLGVTNFSIACQAIKAERKWIMTGTPTPNTPDSDIKRLRPILLWLDSDEFDRRRWVKGIERPYEAFRPCALPRMQELLGRTMIRSSKKLISSMPKCEVSTKYIDFTKESSKSYNELVNLTTRNMILADWYSEEHKESILHPKHVKWCRELLSNLRLSCCVESFFRVGLIQEELRYTLDTLVKYSKTKNWPMALDSLTRRSLSAEDSTFHVPFSVDSEIKATPETHELDSHGRVLRFRAGGGYREYRGRLWEVGNALKHGYHCERCREYTKLPMVTPCAHLLCNDCVLLSRYHCTAPGCVVRYVMESETKQVPKELIELQPSYFQTEPWKEDWKKTHSAKMEYLVPRLLEIPSRGVYSELTKEWTTQRAKVIVFSQFKEHLQLTSVKLQEVPELDKGMSEAYQSRPSVGDKSIAEFRDNSAKWILVMDARFAEGHDLSMVEYIFLLDPIWDLSLEKQVISRAYRMGASKGRVIQVEKLVMKNSIEHEMVLLAEKLRLQPDVGKAKRNTESAKRSTLLKALHVVSQRRSKVGVFETAIEAEQTMSNKEKANGNRIPSYIHIEESSDMQSSDAKREEEANESASGVAPSSIQYADRLPSCIYIESNRDTRSINAQREKGVAKNDEQSVGEEDLGALSRKRDRGDSNEGRNSVKRKKVCVIVLDD